MRFRIRKGYEQKTLISLFKKEDTYGSEVPVNGDNFCLLRGYDITSTAEFEVASDKDDITGTEFATQQELLTNQAKISLKETKAKPNTIAGLCALAAGEIETQPQGLNAFIHLIRLHKTLLPSVNLWHYKNGLWFIYRGLKANTLKISGEAGKTVSVESELLGQYIDWSELLTHEDIIDVKESWLKIKDAKVFFAETGEFSISPPPWAPGTANITPSTPFAIFFKSFEFTLNNNLEGHYGFGSEKFQELDFKRRAIDFKFTLIARNKMEIEYFINQRPLGMEINITGALISPEALYSFILIIPRFQIKGFPNFSGGIGDFITCEIETEFTGTGDDIGMQITNKVPNYLR